MERRFQMSEAMCSCWPEKFKNPLTQFGKETVRESAEKFLSI